MDDLATAKVTFGCLCYDGRDVEIALDASGDAEDARAEAVHLLRSWAASARVVLK